MDFVVQGTSLTATGFETRLGAAGSIVFTPARGAVYPGVAGSGVDRPALLCLAQAEVTYGQVCSTFFQFSVLPLLFSENQKCYALLRFWRRWRSSA